MYISIDKAFASIIAEEVQSNVCQNELRFPVAPVLYPAYKDDYYMPGVIPNVELVYQYQYMKPSFSSRDDDTIYIYRFAGYEITNMAHVVISREDILKKGASTMLNPKVFSTPFAFESLTIQQHSHYEMLEVTMVVASSAWMRDAVPEARLFEMLKEQQVPTGIVTLDGRTKVHWLLHVGLKDWLKEKFSGLPKVNVLV